MIFTVLRHTPRYGNSLDFPNVLLCILVVECNEENFATHYLTKPLVFVLVQNKSFPFPLQNNKTGSQATENSQQLPQVARMPAQRVADPATQSSALC